MIHATLTYSCGGCDAKATSEPVWMRATRDPVFHASWAAVRAAGLPGAVCVTETPKLDAEAHVPEGWVAFDPYTLATYCPACWEQVENGEFA